ncbi:alpha/beta hydrolase [Paenimyroides tangerinum]|uniref:alpha/beta hydrolase n=1 Tax=Paenimyroides tangerinum TaxID=2488728 RepID=UPI001F2611E6|nr:alpha/beta hydrolase [Paenimyroides tangerinum]
MNITKVYIFSGLGADYRAFNNIDFGDLPIEHIAWIEIENNETIESYAKRISEKLSDENPILIGLSFGGILLMEIAKIKRYQKIILIASAKDKFEIPLIYRLLGKLKFNRLIPKSILKKPNPILFWLFGAKTIEEKKLLCEILKDTDPDFLSWAINEISNWKNKTIPKNVVHIHGNKDKIIPFKNVKSNYIIQNGGHLMTMNKADEIQKLILELCRS